MPHFGKTLFALRQACTCRMFIGLAPAILIMQDSAIILQFNALSVLELNISPKLKLGNYTEFKSQELQLPD